MWQVGVCGCFGIYIFPEKVPAMSDKYPEFRICITVIPEKVPIQSDFFPGFFHVFEKQISADYSAADYAAVLIIEYGRLSGRHAFNGLIKNDLHLSTAQIFNGCGAFGLVVSCLCIAADLLTFIRLMNALEINISAAECIDQKVIFSAEHDGVVLRTDLNDKRRNAERNS